MGPMSLVKRNPAAWTALAVALSALPVLPVPGQAQGVEEFRWSGELEAGRTLEVVGLNGGITASPAAGDRVEVTATKRAERSDPASVEIRVLEHAAGITVCAVYPGATGGAPDRCPTKQGRRDRAKNDVSVEFDVRVPRGARFVARTVNGGIEAHELDGDLNLNTVNGGIDLSTSGSASAETVNGSIRATLGRVGGASGNGLAFKTVNGSITVALPSGAGARVSGQTLNGEFESDFPLTIPAGARMGPKRLQGTIGDGGPSLALHTVNGSIMLRERD